MKKVTIIGFGPSSLFAILACGSRNIVPTVYTDRVISAPMGAFYFHEIPERIKHEVKKQTIDYEYRGARSIYLEKQWGYSDVESSWGKFSVHSGYDPVQVFHCTMDLCPINLTYGAKLSYSDILKVARENDLVICSAILHNKPFVSIPIWQSNRSFTAHNHIIYSGSPAENWVRFSYLFGRTCIEYSKDYHKRVLTRILDIEPKYEKGHGLTFPENVLIIGRNARYDRNELAHHAYERTLDELRRIV